jgi:2-keto-3-deoxy-L-rhamnonate aldolase RhmA
LLDAAGCDFALFDLEHCPFSLPDFAGMFPGFRGSRCQPMVRVPAVRREFFQPLLDLGARGIMVPMVEDPETVREAVSLMKYVPRGRRGIHFSTPHTLFQVVDRDAYIRAADNNILFAVQIETAKGLANLDAILAEPGIDVAFVGNADLAASLGLPNNLATGPVHDATRRVWRAAQARGIAGGGNFLNPEFATRFYEDGLRFITLDSEVGGLLAGLRGGMKALRADHPGDAKISAPAAVHATNC